MRNETVYDILKRLRNEKQNWKTKVDQALLGTTVLTKYRNKTYRINEITYDMKPTSTFKKDGKNISYVEYYKVFILTLLFVKKYELSSEIIFKIKQKYNLEIRDPNQPMLVSKVKKKCLYGGMESQDILLVPELCFASGLTEEMQSNYKYDWTFYLSLTFFTIKLYFKGQCVIWLNLHIYHQLLVLNAFSISTNVCVLRKELCNFCLIGT